MTEERSARINRADGDVLGCSVFLNADELRDLGIDPDANRVRYRVDDGQLIFDGGGEQ